jgi:hypothetical protein
MPGMIDQRNQSLRTILADPISTFCFPPAIPNPPCPCSSRESYMPAISTYPDISVRRKRKHRCVPFSPRTHPVGHRTPPPACVSSATLKPSRKALFTRETGVSSTTRRKKLIFRKRKHPKRLPGRDIPPDRSATGRCLQAPRACGRGSDYLLNNMN